MFLFKGRSRKQSGTLVSSVSSEMTPYVKHEYNIKKKILTGSDSSFVSPADAGHVFTGLLRKGVVLNSYIPFGIYSQQPLGTDYVSPDLNMISSLFIKVSNIFQTHASTTTATGKLIANDAIGWSIIKSSEDWNYLVDIATEVCKIVKIVFSERSYIHYPDRTDSTFFMSPVGVCSAKVVDLDALTILSQFISSAHENPQLLVRPGEKFTTTLLSEQVAFLLYFVWCVNYSSVHSFHGRAVTIFSSGNISDVPIAISNLTQYYSDAIVGYIYPPDEDNPQIDNGGEFIASYPTDYIILPQRRVKFILRTPPMTCELQALEIYFLAKYSKIDYERVFGTNLLTQTISFISNAFFGWRIPLNDICVNKIDQFPLNHSNSLNQYLPILRKYTTLDFMSTPFENSDILTKSESIKLETSGEHHLYDMMFVRSLYD